MVTTLWFIYSTCWSTHIYFSACMTIWVWCNGWNSIIIGWEIIYLWWPIDKATALGHAKILFLKINISDLANLWNPLEEKLANECQVFEFTESYMVLSFDKGLLINMNACKFFSLSVWGDRSWPWKLHTSSQMFTWEWNRLSFFSLWKFLVHF